MELMSPYCVGGDVKHCTINSQRQRELSVCHSVCLSLRLSVTVIVFLSTQSVTETDSLPVMYAAPLLISVNSCLPVVTDIFICVVWSTSVAHECLYFARARGTIAITAL